MTGTGILQAWSTQSVKMYLDQGQMLMGEFSYGNSSLLYKQDFAFSGYLVDEN